MEMDLNMTSAMAFAVLGIEATKDESQIRSAYRAALQSNNPEDNPSGFQSVRRAYEKALEYSRTYDDGEEQVKEDMPDADTPIGALMLKLDKTYKSISARINPEAWKELLRDEVFSGLEDYEAARRALFGYLAENYRVPREIYILLDQYFQIKENAQELKEWLPVAFVDFILSNINNAVSGYTCEWMGMLRGADDADYDAFLVYLQELERAYFNTKEQARAFGCIKAIDALGIWHPYYELDKAQYLLAAGEKEKAGDMVRAMADAEEYKGNLHIQTVAGDILWRAGEKDKAYEVLCRSLKLNRQNYVGNRDCAFYELEHGEHAKALRHIYAIRNITNDAEVKEAADRLEKEFIAQQEEQPKDARGADDARLLVYAYLYQNQPDKALSAVTAKPSYETEIKGYHMLLSMIYRKKGDYDNAQKHELLRLENIKRIMKSINGQDEGVRSLDEDDTLESLTCSLSDANTQLGLISMTRARAASGHGMRFRLYEEAAVWLEAACEAVPTNYTARLNLASCRLETGKYANAYDICNLTIKQLGEQDSLLLLKQRVCYEMGSGQEVIDLFYRILAHGAAPVESYAYAARVFLEHRQPDDTLNILQKASEANVEGFELRALRFMYELFSASEAGAEPERMQVKFDDMLREGERNVADFRIADYLAELYYVKAMHLTRTGKNKMMHLRRAIELHDRAKYHMALAAYFLDCNNGCEDALAEYRYIEKYFAPTPELYIRMAGCYAGLKDVGNMRAALQKAVGFEPKGPGVYREAAKLYDGFGLCDESVGLWETYIGFCPEDIAFALCRCGSACMRLGRNGDAIRYLKESLEYADRDKAYSDNRLILACVQELKELYAENGEYERALALLERYSECCTEAHYTFLRLDICYREHSEKKEKKKVLRKIEKAFHQYGTRELRMLYQGCAQDLKVFFHAL